MYMDSQILTCRYISQNMNTIVTSVFFFKKKKHEHYYIKCFGKILWTCSVRAGPREGLPQVQD